ncbi:hypothetical protein ABPG75_011256 [Micractinium tetrahymenae]
MTGSWAMCMQECARLLLLSSQRSGREAGTGACCADVPGFPNCSCSSPCGWMVERRAEEAHMGFHKTMAAPPRQLALAAGLLLALMVAATHLDLLAGGRRLGEAGGGRRYAAGWRHPDGLFASSVPTQRWTGRKGCINVASVL